MNRDNISPQIISDLTYEFRKSRVFLTAFELEIFSVLEKSKKTSLEVASELNLNPKATDRLMNALVAIELLRKNDNLFENTAVAEKYLVKNSPNYFSSIGHSISLWKTWSNLTEIVKTGSSTIEEIQFRGEKWLREFISAMHDRAKKNSQETISKIDLTNVEKILDIGGGSGVYSFAFVKKCEHCTATVFDLPEVISLTQEYIEKENLSHKVFTLKGNYLTENFGENLYDLVFLSAIIHINSETENIELLQKCFKSLRNNGKIVIQDYIMNEERTLPLVGALFAINMLVGTRRGDTYTETEMSSWLKIAGFCDIEQVESVKENTQIIAHKKL